MRGSLFLGVAALLVACGDTRDPDGSGTTLTTVTASASDSGTGSSTGDETTGTDKLDVGNGSASQGSADDGGNGMGCAKVDFLFVIDNSGSMADEQANLVASFPKFIETIKSTLDMAQSYHIMVADTDAWVFGGCEMLCGLFGSCIVAPQYQCGVTQPMECEDVLGAGVTYPRGPDASNTDCAFSTGLRYMDTSETDLVGKFSCAAKVGSGSTMDPEKPMEAMVAAVSGNGEVGTCNQGFLRDDAILVVTFITDEDDNDGDGSLGTVDGWRQALIAAKNGDESAIVVLGLFGDQDQANPVCDPLDPDAGNGAEPSPRLRQFVESFGSNGFAGSVCAPSYESFFQEAVGIIDTACDDFIPPG